MKHRQCSCIFLNLRHMESVSFSLKFGSSPVGLLGQVRAKHLGLLLAPAKDFSISNFKTLLDQKASVCQRQMVTCSHYLETLHWTRSHWLSVMLVTLENRKNKISKNSIKFKCTLNMLRVCMIFFTTSYSWATCDKINLWALDGRVFIIILIRSH